MAGLTSVPAIVQDYTDERLLEVALVEGQLARINRKVGFPNPEGGEDGG